MTQISNKQAKHKLQKNKGNDNTNTHSYMDMRPCATKWERFIYSQHMSGISVSSVNNNSRREEYRIDSNYSIRNMFVIS